MVAVPIRRDAGHVEVFPAYRVQHSSVLGPTKGGIRYDPHVTLGECTALAVWMTWKCALLPLADGGRAEGARGRKCRRRRWRDRWVGGPSGSDARLHHAGD